MFVFFKQKMLEVVIGADFFSLSISLQLAAIFFCSCSLMSRAGWTGGRLVNMCKCLFKGDVVKAQNWNHQTIPEM